MHMLVHIVHTDLGFIQNVISIPLAWVGRGNDWFPPKCNFTNTWSRRLLPLTWAELLTLEVCVYFKAVAWMMCLCGLSLWWCSFCSYVKEVTTASAVITCYIYRENSGIQSDKLIIIVWSIFKPGQKQWYWVTHRGRYNNPSKCRTVALI